MADNILSESDKKIVLKAKKKKFFRRTDDDDSDEDDVELFAKLQETRELQKLREQPHGISAVSLAIGKKVSLEEEVVSKDPFKIKTGGLVNMSALKSGKVKQVDDAYDTGIGTQFSAETNKRDEDEEMMKYIEVELAKRKGAENGNRDSMEAGKYLSPEEAALQSLPDHLRTSSMHKSEEMLSNQMLSGIPEVDLGIDAKIKNIEATEEAKLKLLWERRNKRDGPSQFVPTNMAVNFVQHNRFNLDGDGLKRKKPIVEKPAEVKVVADTSANNKTNRKDKGEKATDDYHYEKFKKQFRRY